jgi:radical SAM protein with 4Fe4S-binding SPASM domain
MELIPQQVMIYLKTTETCQLDCDHCFTSGSNGKKIFFNTNKIIDWYKRLKECFPNVNGGHTAFHGGEPFLASVEDMWKVYNGCKDVFEDMWWSVTTNLVFPLTEDKLEFIEKALNNNISTSWDKGIRFSTKKQEDLWEKNVRTLTKIPDFNLTCQISISRSITEMKPKEIIDKMIDLGINNLHLERISLDGNAKKNLDILPHNKEQDKWFLDFWEEYIKDENYKKIHITFFESILTSLVYNTHSGCRCRQCEQKIFTLNANGTIGGCPNSAATNPYGNIDMDIMKMMTSPGRMENIICETNRDSRCMECPVQDICNGDCHQLDWDGDICPAPISLMKKLKKENNQELYKNVLGDFMGKE